MVRVRAEEHTRCAAAIHDSLTDIPGDGEQRASRFLAACVSVIPFPSRRAIYHGCAF